MYTIAPSWRLSHKFAIHRTTGRSIHTKSIRPRVCMNLNWHLSSTCIFFSCIFLLDVLFLAFAAPKKRKYTPQSKLNSTSVVGGTEQTTQKKKYKEEKNHMDWEEASHADKSLCTIYKEMWKMLSSLDLPRKMLLLSIHISFPTTNVYDVDVLKRKNVKRSMSEWETQCIATSFIALCGFMDV